MPDVSRPDHVPEYLVIDFDVYLASELTKDPHQNMGKILRDAPEIFWTNSNGGHWIVARVDSAMEMLRSPHLFSSDPIYNRARKQWPRLAPNQYDPPIHTQFRSILNPWFTPRAVREREGEIRSLAAELIDGVVAQRGCEFVEEIADQFSVTIFMRMVNAPLADRNHLLRLAAQWTRGADRTEAQQKLQELARYLLDLMAARRRAPADDLLSHIISSSIEGRPLHDEELLGLTTLTFLGGLDTVSAMLSFIMAFLGRYPGHYSQLVENPKKIDAVIEELIRPHGVAGMERAATESVNFRGVDFEKGDRVVFMPQMFGLDEDWVESPLAIDFERARKPSPVFGGGPHRCVGAHLARSELVIFLEEWVARIPRFEVAPDWNGETRGGMVWTVAKLPLVWPS